MAGIIIVMAFLARASGGGLRAERTWSGLPELLFGLPFGIVFYLNWVNSFPAEIVATALAALVAWMWSYACMEMGHGNFYGMRGVRIMGKQERIEKWGGRYLFQRLGGNIHSSAYSWWCMGLKGLLIGLPAAPFGLLLAVLWPFSYWIGMRVENEPAVSEWISGMMAGYVLWLSLAY